MRNIEIRLIKSGVLIATTVLGLMGTPRSLAQMTVTPIDSPIVNQLGIGTNLIDVLKTAGGYLMGFGGVLAVLFLIYGGIIYITGGAKAEESAKKIIMNAIIGLIVMALSYVIASFALTVLGA